MTGKRCIIVYTIETDEWTKKKRNNDKCDDDSYRCICFFFQSSIINNKGRTKRRMKMKKKKKKHVWKIKRHCALCHSRTSSMRAVYYYFACFIMCSNDQIIWLFHSLRGRFWRSLSFFLYTIFFCSSANASHKNEWRSWYVSDASLWMKILYVSVCFCNEFRD